VAPLVFYRSDHRHIRVTTDLSPDELLSLSAGQLAEAG
jgi:hypothetical protein